MARFALRAAALHLCQLYACAALRARPRRQRGRAVGGAPQPTEAPHPYSLSCNPDLTLDLLALRRRGRVDFVFAGQVNSELPFMPGDAAIGAEEFDFMLVKPGDRFSAVRPAARAGVARRLRGGTSCREPRARRRHAADRHRLAGRRRGAGAGSAPAQQCRVLQVAGAPRVWPGADMDRSHRAICRRALRLHGNVRRRHARSFPRRHPQARSGWRRAACRLLSRLARVLSAACAKCRARSQGNSA